MANKASKMVKKESAVARQLIFFKLKYLLEDSSLRIHGVINMKNKRKLAVLFLILPIFFSIFLGTSHHFCNHFSKRCLICHQLGSQQGILLIQENTRENINPTSVSSYLVTTREYNPDPVLILLPLKGRAPPIYS